MTGLLQRVLSFSATMRDKASAVSPPGNSTMILTNLLGYGSACADTRDGIEHARVRRTTRSVLSTMTFSVTSARVGEIAEEKRQVFYIQAIDRPKDSA